MPGSEIKLDAVWQKRYKIARFFVYLIFVLGFFYAVYLVLFPSANFIFSFPNPDSSKNTLVEPRNESGNLVRNGKIDAGKKLIFDTNPLGDFSEAEVEFTLESKSGEIGGGSVSVRRSFRSFFYPEGEKIENAENQDFISLLSTKESVFLASDGKVWPIADAVTFESMGFNWSDVIPSNSEEIGKFEKQKLFTIKNPHPDGTVFFDEGAGKYYLISQKEKHEIEGKEIIGGKIKTNPIIADEKGLEVKSSCQLESSLGFSRKYKCVIPVDEMRKLPGNDFQFEASFEGDAGLRNIGVTFKKSFNMENLRSSITNLKNRTAANYGQAN